MTTSTVASTPAGQNPPLAPLDLHIDETPADAHSYTFSAPDGRLLASLLVLLDNRLATTRAELYYYDNTLDRSTRDAILRRARNIIGIDYHGGGGLNTPLAVSNAERQITISVDHMNGDPTYKAAPAYSLWKVAAAILAVSVFIIVLGLMVNAFRNREPEQASAPSVAAQPAPVGGVAARAVEAIPEIEAGAPAGVDPASLQPNTNGLPPSVNADPGLALGGIALMGEGYNSYIRSLPGAEAGEAVGYLRPGDQATIIGGPTWLKGDSDTIVWWYVRTADGLVGWTPANTSTLTLLKAGS